jgi:hypothetical protein
VRADHAGVEITLTQQRMHLMRDSPVANMQLVHANTQRHADLNQPRLCIRHSLLIQLLINLTRHRGVNAVGNRGWINHMHNFQACFHRACSQRFMQNKLRGQISQFYRD